MGMKGRGCRRISSNADRADLIVRSGNGLAWNASKSPRRGHLCTGLTSRKRDVFPAHVMWLDIKLFYNSIQYAWMRRL